MIKNIFTKVLCGVMLLTTLMPAATVFAEDGEDFETVTIDISELEPIGEDYTTESKYAYMVKTNGGNLNVRETPSTDGKIIGTLPNGTVVEVYYIQKAGTPAGWSYISYPMEGYVSSAYLEFYGTP